MFNELNYQNSNAVLPKDMDLKAMDFKPLKDFKGKEFFLEGFFFTEGKFGKQVSIVGDGVKINMPKRYTTVFEDIIKDKEKCTAILNNKVKIVNIRAQETKNGSTTTFDFKDC